jgi:hypothetical protein
MTMGISFIDTAAHPLAPSYYKAMKAEPTRLNGKTAIWETFQRKPVELPHMTLRKLLASMANSVAPGSCSAGLIYPGEDVLICSHGTERQLMIPIDTGGSNLSEQSIPLLEKCLRLEAGDETAEATVKEVAGQFFISEKSLKPVLRDLKKVRALNIGHIAFRACMIGNTPGMLACLKRLFNADSISAPNVYDGYNTFSPKVAKDSDSFERYLRAHPDLTADGYAPDRMVVKTSKGSNSHKWKIEGLAESDYAIYLWYLRKYPFLDAPPNSGTKFPIHAMILDKIDYGAVFPGDLAYLGHLVHWTKSEASYLD